MDWGRISKRTDCDKITTEKGEFPFFHQERMSETVVLKMP